MIVSGIALDVNTRAKSNGKEIANDIRPIRSGRMR